MGYRFKIALVAFVFSFMIFFPIGAFFAIGVIQQSDKGDQPINRFQFLIPKDYDTNVLFVNCNQCEGRNVADVFLLFKISPHDNSIGLLSIPNRFKTVFQNRNSSLKEFFEYGGVGYVKKILEDLLSIQIDRTIQATDRSIKGAINCLGGLELSSNESGAFFEGLPVVGGKKIMGGENFSKFLKIDPVKAFLFLKNAFKDSNNLVKFFVYFANMFNSNFTAYDFEVRKKSFEEMISKNNAAVLCPKLEFKNFEGRHVLVPLSKKSCFNVFKKN